MNSRTPIASEGRLEIASVVYEVVMRHDPTRLLELLYYAEEPGVLELVRALMAMESETREAIGTFLSVHYSDAADADENDDPEPLISPRRKRVRGRRDVH